MTATNPNDLLLAFNVILQSVDWTDKQNVINGNNAATNPVASVDTTKITDLTAGQVFDL